MKNGEFKENHIVELLKDSIDPPMKIPKGTAAVITKIYSDGGVRLASNTGKNYRWEIYLHRDSNFSKTIKVINVIGTLGKLVISRHDFDGEEFNAVMTEGDGRRLWVTYIDGGHFFKVEDMRKDEVVCKTASFGAAVNAFNKLR